MAKKNLLKVPQQLLDRLAAFGQDDVVVACVKIIPRGNIDRYAGVGLSLAGEDLVVPEPTTPRPSAGRYSRANVEGYTKVLRNEPKYPKTIEWEAPSWGSGDTHTVSRTMMVYPREFYPPKQVELSVEELAHDANTFTVKFAIEQVINRQTPNFQKELLYNLNILQENVGAVDLFLATTTSEEYAAAVRVHWELLPVGSREQIMQRLLQRNPNMPQAARDTVDQRLRIFESLRPERLILGSSGFSRYIGAKFRDDFVAFENVRYGNAIYLMFDRWQELSMRTRVELLSGPQDGFERILHNAGWEARLRARVAHVLAR